MRVRRGNDDWLSAGDRPVPGPSDLTQGVDEMVMGVHQRVVEYHRARALGFLATRGPEAGAQAIYALGLEPALAATSMAEAAAALGGVWAAGRAVHSPSVQRSRAQLRAVARAGAGAVGRPMIEFADRLSDYVAFLLRRPSWTRREYLLLSGLALASGCGGGGSSSPSSPSPTPTPGALSGTVTSLDGKPVNGTIDFLRSTNGLPLATGPVNGSYNVTFPDDRQIAQIKRVRISGDAAVCNTEVNYSGNKDFKVLDRKLGIGDEYPRPLGTTVENPSFYDLVVRHGPTHAGSLPGNKRVTQDMEFVVTGNIGGGVQSPDERLAILRDAINEIYPLCTNKSFNGTFRFESNPPSRDGIIPGAILFNLDNSYYNLEYFDGYRVSGAVVHGQTYYAPNPDPRVGGNLDRAELAQAILFYSESEAVQPSIANEIFNVAFTYLQPVDYNIKFASEFESLGTKKMRVGNLWIESYEPVV